MGPCRRPGSSQGRINLRLQLIVVASFIANALYTEGRQVWQPFVKVHTHSLDETVRHADICIRSLQDASRVEPRLLLGIKSAEYSGTFVVNSHPTEDFVKAPAGIHIVIPTTGEALLNIKATWSFVPQPNFIPQWCHKPLAHPVQVEEASSGCLSPWNRSSAPR